MVILRMSVGGAEFVMGWVHPWVGLGWVGLGGDLTA